MGTVGEKHVVPDAMRGLPEKMIKTRNSVDTGGFQRWEKSVFILQLVGNIKNIVLPKGYMHSQ